MDIENLELAREKYNRALNVVKGLLEKIIKDEPLLPYTDEILKTIDLLIDELKSANALLELEAQDYEADNYIPCHLLNVCILSLSVGMQLVFSRQKLQILGLASIFHDAGLVFMKETIMQPVKFEDTTEIRGHLAKSVEIVEKLGEPYEKIKEIVQQHHERADGKGYPLGLKNEIISNYAKIIGLADTYEAMTHLRSYRKAEAPHVAIKELFSSLKESFDHDVIKALFSRLSIYPIGTFVKLNTGETAKVISANPASPLRPTVLIIKDIFEKYVFKPQVLDLSKESSVYITDFIASTFT